MGLTIDIQEGEGRHLVKAAGEIDLNSSPELRKALLKEMKDRKTLAVDLQDIAYMDSSGVATLVEGLKSCSGKGQQFVLLSPSESVMKVLKLARLDALFDIRSAL